MKINELKSAYNKILNTIKNNKIVSKINLDKRQKLTLIIGIVFSILSILFSETIFVGNNEIKRAKYGKTNNEYTLSIHGISAKPDYITFNVSAMKYTKKEADEAFDILFSNISKYILKNNKGFDQINEDLNFIEYFKDEGINVNYLFKLDNSYDEDTIDKYKDVILYNGKVNNHSFKNDEAINGELKIIFSCFISDKYNSKYSSSPYIIPIKIISKNLSGTEKHKYELLSQIERIDKDTINNNTIKLPTKLDGSDIHISYKEKPKLTFLFIIFISLIVTILIPFNDKSKKNEEVKSKLRLLSKEYYSFVTKLTIYIGAGETLKNSISRIITTSKQNENSAPSILNNELEILIRKLNNGVTEDIALSEISNRIGLRQYTKLFNILEQNRKNGSTDVRVALTNELNDAFNERKLQAKILGEEAQTKLIFPLIMILGIILLIIMVPALTGM